MSLRVWTGSPPRMRGKELPAHVCLEGLGITPAHAGKSISLPFWSRKIKDHPRACGEKSFAAAYLDMAAGSPPRMRGKGISDNLNGSGAGITPAHAGKSLCFI